MTDFPQDLRYGVRTLARSPGFTAVALLSLALGIGANTAIFTLTNAVFLRPLPVKDPGRVVELFAVDHLTVNPVANLDRTPISYKNYLDIREQNNVFSGLAGFFPAGVTLSGYGDPKPIPAVLATANYFDVLGVKPAAGRFFLPDEDSKPGGNRVAVLSHSVWTKQFGADRGVIGRAIVLNATPYTVIGVAPAGFKGTVAVGDPDNIWLPMSMHAQVLPGDVEALFNSRRMRVISTFGRLRPGISEGQALAAAKTIAARLEAAYPRDNKGRTVEMSTLSEAALAFLPRDQLVMASLALSGVVALVLLIACVNVANLLLARSAKRTREMGIRTALGAERGRLVRQLLTENLLLSAGGGALGLWIGWLGSRLLWSFRPSFLTGDSLTLQLDARVCIFALAVTAITAALFGLLPALRAATPDLSALLKSGGRAGSEPWAKSGLRSALVVAEIALALVALTGAGLFIRSMQNAQKINPGFESTNLFTFSFDLSSRNYSPDRAHQFYRAVLDRALSTPGVAAAGLASNAPFAGGILGTARPEGMGTTSDQGGLLATINGVSPTYFETMRIPLRSGRLLTDFDGKNKARVAVVSEAMARHFWPGQNALGKRFRFATDPDAIEVVGTVRDSVVAALGEQPQPVAYLPLEQQSIGLVTLHVRTNSSPAAILPGVRAGVQSLDKDLALANVNTIQETMAQGLWAPRTGAALFGLFGLLGMLLASLGTYGVMAYLVAQRTNEIGIRMALGASRYEVLGLVIGQSMRLVGTGIVLGLIGAFALARLTGSLLFGISPSDPSTFVVVSAVLAAVAFLATWPPASRAASVDPLVALRDE
ncbi:MAG TPA: ABC transporter permease [Bryobacteraceae bacterium]|nr:ABC transporter permease [Bryobacteraceae bacterium]